MDRKTEPIKLRMPHGMVRALRADSIAKGASVAALIRMYVGLGLRLPPNEHHPRPYARRKARKA